MESLLRRRLVALLAVADETARFFMDVDLTMAQIGATKISDLGPQFLMWKDEEDLRRNKR